MKDTKLILIEGVSGSGKSTLAQFLTRVLTNQGISCQWRYEEEKDHPLYIFHDQQSLQNVIDALSSTNFLDDLQSSGNFLLIYKLVVFLTIRVCIN
jgi:thymidylate kinase